MLKTPTIILSYILEVLSARCGARAIVATHKLETSGNRTLDRTEAEAGAEAGY